MKLLLISDIHLTRIFDPLGAIPYSGLESLGREDVLCLAGDVDDGPSGMNEHLKHLREFTDAVIVAVMGNHDFYGRMLSHGTPDEARAGLPERVHILENQSLTVGDVRILGCTLWTDADRGWVTGNANSMPDFSEIYSTDPSEVFIHIDEMLAVNQISKEWLAAELAKPFEGKTVVMTHHAPSFKSQHPKHEGSPISGFFCCDVEYLIEAYRPLLWLHGHLHDPVDYVIGQTRIVSNPRGDFGERDPNYAPKLIEL
ncbi:MAG: metallophosphoesterase [Halothiobacillus sp.]